MNDRERYAQWVRAREDAWEGLCNGCGACCGISDGDPCEHLEAAGAGVWKCRIYDNRFGEHATVSGRRIRCVPVRDILHTSWPGDEACSYKHHQNVFVRLSSGEA